MRLMSAWFMAALLGFAAFTATNADAQVSDRAFPVNGATELRLNVSGNIHLLPSSAAQAVTFHVVDYGPPIPAMKFTSSRSGKRLTITVSGPGRQILPFTGASGYELQVSYPAGLAIDLREFAGHVAADELTSPTQVYNADGSVTIAGARAVLTAEADNGAIDVTDAHTTLQLTTANGPVTARLASDWHGSLVRIESSNGSLSLAVPSGFRGRYDLATAQGRVQNALRSASGAPLVFMLTQDGNISVAAPAR